MAVSGDQDIAAFEEDGHVVLRGAAAPENRHDPRIHEALAQLWGERGDQLIWVGELARGNGHNTSGTLRFPRCITMSPARDDGEEARRQRIDLFEQRKPPRPAHPGDPRGWGQGQTRAELTPRARTLLLLDRR